MMSTTSPPGGGPDIVGRLVAQHLTQRWGQQALIDNIGGGGGTTGSLRVAKAPPDGYQFVYGNIGTHAINLAEYVTGLHIKELAADTAIQAADTLLLTVPNQLGVEYNAHAIESILKYVAPELGWR